MSHRVRLVLELVGEGPEPIVGSVRREGGAERAFTGWLELMALVGEEMELDQARPAEQRRQPEEVDEQ